MDAIRHIWIFLKKQHRADPNYYKDLKELFILDDNFMVLPGREPNEIMGLSEAEYEAVFDSIKRHSLDPILYLRDTALFFTAIETTMRLDSLHSMDLENLKEPSSGIYKWHVRAKRSPKKDSKSRSRLGEGKAEWRDWYISPHALSCIGQYLKKTDRNWQSTGPVWLTAKGKPLTKGGLQLRITYWLKVAHCSFTRPHVLRHTGISQLINKYNKSIPTVQAISQHSDPAVLINVYAQGAVVDAFRMVNQIYPDEAAKESNCQEMLTSIGVRLNELSATLSRRKQDRRVFTHQHVEELLVALRQETTRLANFLDVTPSTQVVAFSKEDYQRLADALHATGLSFEHVLGYAFNPPFHTVIKRSERKPKSPLDL